MRKTCITCKRNKDTKFFHTDNSRKDNLNPRCKDCMREKSRLYYSQNREKVIQKNSQYYRNNKKQKRQYDRERRKRKRQQINEASTRWREKNPQKRQQVLKRYYESVKTTQAYKTKENTRQILRQALTDGELIRPTVCSQCNRNTNTEAHHDDYSKPLDVTWLCKSCHSVLHRKY